MKCNSDITLFKSIKVKIGFLALRQITLMRFGKNNKRLFPQPLSERETGLLRLRRRGPFVGLLSNKKATFVALFVITTFLPEVSFSRSVKITKAAFAASFLFERETGLEPATPTLARSCSTN
jgi:hypothetical protein